MRLLEGLIVHVTSYDQTWSTRYAERGDYVADYVESQGYERGCGFPERALTRSM